MRSVIFIIAFLVFSSVQAQQVSELLHRAEELHNSQPDSSYQLCVQAEEMAIAAGDKQEVANAKLCKVRFLLLRNRLEVVAKELNEAIVLYQETDSPRGLALAYLSMSNLAGRIQKDLEEIEYLEKARDVFEQMHDTAGLQKTLSNLSLNYTALGQLDKGEMALRSLEKVVEGMPEKEFYYLNQNWGIFYEKKQDYPAALRRFRTAQHIAENNNMIDSKATVLYLISGVYLKKGEIEMAEEAINESYRISVENDLIIEQLEALQLLRKIQEQQEDVASAYETFQKIVAIKDTIYNLERVNKINDYERKIALAEKEKIITTQQLDLEKNKNQLLKDKYEIYALSGGLVLGVIFVTFLLINLRSRKKAHQIISSQKEEVERQKQIVDEKNHQILSSITYAKRIQEAILPQDKLVKEYLENSFVFYRAKDIVSGDFYWMHQTEQNKSEVLFAAVDCTGHGVPGAFMSIVGNNALNKAVRELKLTKPSQILDALNMHVTSALHQKSNEMKDGMDIALCRLNLKTRELQFAGANNPLYIARQTGELEVIKGDKQSIGDAQDLYTHHTIKMEEGDCLYVFTDGYADQFGGERDKKFGTVRFRELLLSLRELPMHEQRAALRHTLDEWMETAGTEQVDDICVVGVRV